MKTVAFVVNRLAEFNFSSLLEKYLADVRVSVLDYFPETPRQFDLIVLWSFRQVVRHPEPLDNVIIFHSSDLPRGRGWAPLYNMFANGDDYYTLCGVKLANPVDTGDIVVRARFPILPHYTAARVREFDHQLSIMLVGEVLRRFQGDALSGVSQSGPPSYYRRRVPDDNKVDTSCSLDELLPHLRGCEPQHPAFFVHGGEKFFLEIRPEREAVFPENIEIVFPS